MDDTDIKILTILQKKATIPLSELSKIVGITPTPCWNRIKKMEEEKIIISKVTLIDNKKVNLPIVAFLSIQITNHTGSYYVIIYRFPVLLHAQSSLQNSPESFRIN